MTRKKASKKNYRSNSCNINYNDNSNKPTKNLSKENPSNQKIKGLLNLGNTCYFNSMLQMILNSPQFMSNLKAFCSSDYELNINMDSKEIKLILKSSEVSCVENELIKIWENGCPSVSPAGLRNALLKNDQFRSHFGGFNEQDSHEAFLMTLNIIKEAQIKRIKKAILDKYDCRSNVDKLDNETKAEIKSLGLMAERQTVIQSHFGIVVGSALRCLSCDEMRLRFDECLHLTPQFPGKSEIHEDLVANKRNEDNVGTFGKTAVDADEQRPQKLSKYQQKKMKRIERKAARNKKSQLRNEELMSPTDEGDTHSQPNVTSNPLMLRFLEDSNEPIESATDETEETMEPQEFPFNEGNNNNIDEEIDFSNSIDPMIVVVNMDEINVDRTSESSRAANASGSSRSSLLSDTPGSDICGEYEQKEEAITEQFQESLCLVNCSLETEAVDDEVELSDPIENPNSLSNSSSETSVMNRTDARSAENLQEVFSAILESHPGRLNRSSQTDLERALERFIDPLFVENLVCDSCSTRKSSPVKVNHRKTDIICHLPLILPIYISRFKQVLLKQRSSKNTQIYSYPLLLDLSLQSSQYANVGQDTSPVVYRLFGIIEHIGARINSGHYVSYVCAPRDKDAREMLMFPQSYSSNICLDICHKHDQKIDQINQHFLNDKDSTELVDEEASNYDWFRISDSHVESVSRSSVLNCQAFMLFYIRVQ